MRGAITSLGRSYRFYAVCAASCLRSAERSMPSPSVLVVGSLNIDYIASVPRFPAAGETVAATGLIQRFGGKGANQAIAAARQGARVSMLGCVGDDDNGRAYRDRLCQEGINAAGVCTTKKALTGTALIAVDTHGE